MIMLCALYYGAMYGGSTTSILVNVPGEASSVVTAIEGHQLARQGKAGTALGLSAIGSFFAGIMGTIGLAFTGVHPRRVQPQVRPGRNVQPRPHGDVHDHLSSAARTSRNP